MTIAPNHDNSAGIQRQALISGQDTADSPIADVHAPVTAVAPPPSNPVAIVTQLVSAALAPFLAPSPSAPADPPLLLGVLAWARREIQRSFLNTAPQAVPDSVSTSQNTDIEIDVLRNDVDPDDRDVKTVGSYTQPTHGEVVLNDDGTFTYTPDQNYHGADSFTYTVTDETSPWHLHGLSGGGHTNSQSATVTVDVISVNSPATVNPDTATVAEDSTANPIDVLANDYDPDGTLTLTGTPSATKGTATISNGKILYTPNANYRGTDTITYSVKDPNGNTTDGTVTVTVTQVNDTATVKPDTATVAEDSTANPIDVLANDYDPDGTLTLTGTPSATKGTATISNGKILYTPNADFSGTDTSPTPSRTPTETPQTAPSP